MTAVVTILVVATVGLGTGQTVAQTSTDLTVTPDGSGEYTSIQSAIDNAESGDRIEVAPGTYEESINIDKSVMIVASEGATIKNTSSIGTQVGLRITGDVSPDISGFTLVDWQWAVGAGASEGEWTVRKTTIIDSECGVCAFGTPGDWTVTNVSIVNTTTGINAYDSTGDSTIHDTTIRDGETAIEASDASGNLVIEGVTIRNVADGVDVERASGTWHLEQTIIENSTEDAIDAVRISGDATMRQVSIYTTAGDGIKLDAATGTWTIQDTTIRGADEDGIDAYRANNVGIMENVTIANAENGINMYNTSGVWSITDAEITNTRWAVNAGNTDSQWTVSQSTLVNSAEAINADGANPRGNASYNYWGAADGPSGDFGGSGSAAVGNVTVRPYYTDAALTTLSQNTTEGSPLDGMAANYDANEDGAIAITELGSAATDYARNTISISDLGDVAVAYAAT